MFKLQWMASYSCCFFSSVSQILPCIEFFGHCYPPPFVSFAKDSVTVIFNRAKSGWSGPWVPYINRQNKVTKLSRLAEDLWLWASVCLFSSRPRELGHSHDVQGWSRDRKLETMIRECVDTVQKAEVDLYANCCKTHWPNEARRLPSWGWMSSLTFPG